MRHDWIVRLTPPEIIAIDWGATPAKRQLCRAVLRGKRYSVDKPVAVADPAQLELPRGALIAFDCPIGLGHSYAQAAGLTSFREALRTFGRGRFEHFYDVATAPTEISVERPFYPGRSAGASRDHLRQALGDAAFDLRACDRATGAGPLFWLVGAKQCGRSSIVVWRDILAPRLDEIALWPFDGPLERLLMSGKPVVAEMYPAFLARWLGLDVSNKRDPQLRTEAGKQLTSSIAGMDLIAVRDQLLNGFGASPSGEDAFDATIAAIALVKLMSEGRLSEPPDESRTIEGWILGL